MTHRLPRRGPSMTKIVDRINKQAEGIVAQWSTLDDHDKAISDLWDECARVEQATASRVNNRHTAMALDNLDRVTADLLARVRDLELVVATEAKPRIVGRELTPEQVAARDALREALRPAVEREVAKLTDQRRQQAAQESQEQAPEDTGTATPRLTQRQRLVRADWALVWAQRHEGDRRRHDVVVALDWLREWADEAEVDTRQAIQAVAWMIPATDTDADRDWRLSEARRQIKQQLEDPSRNSYPVPVAIGLLTALEPESESEPQATPDPDDLLTRALEQVSRARDGDACIVDRACPLVDRLGIDHCDREHVSLALGLLRQWQDAAGVDKRDYSAHVHWTSPEAQLSAAAWAIEYGLRWAHRRETWVALARARLERWQEQTPDDDVIDAEMPTLPPDPTPTQRAGQVIHHLGLAMIEERGARHWVEEARRALTQWPGMGAAEQGLYMPSTISADPPAGLLLAAVEHVAAAAPHRYVTGMADWRKRLRDLANAVNCLDEWLRREAQA